MLTMEFRHFRRQLPILFAVAVVVVVGYVLHHQLDAISLRDVQDEIRSLTATQLSLAFLCTIVSYLSLTNYDRLALQYVKHRIDVPELLSISFTAFAIGHNVGFAAVSGGSIRFRAYSAEGLSAVEIGKVIAFCSLTFAIGGSLLLGTTLSVESSE
jgi:glycosyltransferase 2 family protein